MEAYDDDKCRLQNKHRDSPYDGAIAMQFNWTIEYKLVGYAFNGNLSGKLLYSASWCCGVFHDVSHWIISLMCGWTRTQLTRCSNGCCLLIKPGTKRTNQSLWVAERCRLIRPRSVKSLPELFVSLNVQIRNMHSIVA